MFTLAFTRRFSMSHRLLSPRAAKCGIPHGHNEHVTVHLAATEPGPLDGDENMVRPFETAKRRWHDWIDEHVDHTLHLGLGDPLLDYFRAHEPERLGRVLITPGDPTTEALAAAFMGKISAFLAAESSGLRCTEVRIEETPTNTVIFDGDPAAALPRDGFPDPPWWLRADDRIHDL